MTLRQLRAPAVIALLALAAACGKSSAPTPVAVATPTPAPAPSAAATPRVFSCPYPALPDLHNTCPKLAPELDRYVNNAVEDVVAKHPELFDFTNNLGDGSWKVLDRQKYVDAVVEAIHAQGVCAKDDNEEIAVKNTNSFHEQYNIYTSGGYVRRSYITTCIPAQF